MPASANKTIRRNISQKSELINDLQSYCINPDSREIYLHGTKTYQDEESGVDFEMCSKFIKNLNFLHHLSRKDPILIHSITCGGEWEYGMAIYDAIKACPTQITILAYAHARSMSSIIFQAADYRVMMPNSVFMIHEGTMGMYDTVKGFQTAAEEVKKSGKIMLDIYVERIKYAERWNGQSDNAIRKFLQDKMDRKQEWYLSAREAVKLGFADAVLGDPGYETVHRLQKHE